MPLLEGFRSIEVRAIGLPGRSGSWQLAALRAFLSPDPASAPSRGDLPKAEGVVVSHERWDIGRLDELLKALEMGEVRVGSGVLGFRRPNTNPPVPQPYYNLSPRAQADHNLDFAALVLSVSDAIANQIPPRLPEVLDLALRAADPPWDGLADLKENFVGVSGQAAANWNWMTLEVIAPVGANLARDAELVGTELHAKVVTLPGTDLGKVALGVIAGFPDGRTSRTSLPLGGNAGHGTPVDIELDLGAKPSRVLLLLSYHGIDADRLELYGSGWGTSAPRAAIFQEVVGSPRRFGERFERMQGQELEDRVALLFHLLGFSPGHYGALPGDTVDVVAFPEGAPWCLAIECCGREPDLNNKMTKLATRTKGIARASGRPTFPVVITSLPRDFVNKTDLEKAAKEAIAVVTADEWPALVEMALAGPGPADVRARMEALIPQAGLSWPNFARWGP